MFTIEPNRVRVYDYVEGHEVFRAECELTECFPDGGPEYVQAQAYLTLCGRYWAGGGAAPMVLLETAVQT
jgi:hypothetical protein